MLVNMVGTLPMVGSSVVDSHTSPCLCLDALPTTYSMSLKSTCGDSMLPRKSLMRKKCVSKPATSLELSSPFVHSWHGWRVTTKSSSGVVNRRSRQGRKKAHRLVVSNELGGQYEDTFEDVKTQLLNYFTYKAVRTVLNQLYEMNPTTYRWFYDFVASNKPADGKRFLRNLGKEKHDLAERVMVTRLHLYGRWIKKCNHADIYQEISDENLELMRERLLETVIWPSDDTNTEKIG